MGFFNQSTTIDLDLLLQTKFTSAFRPGYTESHGITLPVRYEELKEAIDNFEVFDDDVWVCSFPKTGTTWSQEMVWLIDNDFDYEGAQENIGSRFPFLEVSIVFDWRKLQASNDDFTPPKFLDDSLKFVREAKRPRYIKTHLPFNLLPKQIRTGERQPKIIYITRNPKSVCVSYYHHSRLIEGFSGNFDEFVQLFIAGKVIFGPFWENVLPFWQRRHESNILFIKYEDMKQNLPQVIADTAGFLKKEIDREEMIKLLKHLSFDSMKTNQAVNYEPFLDFHRKHRLVQVEGVFMRSGSKENHKTEMAEEISQQFDAWMKNADPTNAFQYY